MRESWDLPGHWKDYYKILQLDSSAEPEVIKAAYFRLAQKYAPDHNKAADANARMKEINEAYEYLGNPEKRKEYDIVWRQKNAKSAPGSSTPILPRPIAEPSHIRFNNVEPGEIMRASFTIRNIGGPYSKVLVGKPDSWIKVTNTYSLTTTDKLPIKVDIEATGYEWARVYVGQIVVKLDKEEFRVRIELQTKPAPLRSEDKVSQAAGTRPKSKPQQQTTPEPDLPWWGKYWWAKYMIALGVIAVLTIMIKFIFLTSKPHVTNETPETTTLMSETTTLTWENIQQGMTGPVLLKQESGNTYNELFMIYSEYLTENTPIIDGIATEDEWGNASLVKMFEYTIDNEKKTGNITGYFINDDKFLYFCMTISTKDFKKEVILQDRVLFHLTLFFDGNNDGLIDVGDDRKRFALGMLMPEGVSDGFWYSYYGDLHMGEQGWEKLDTTKDEIGAVTLDNNTGTLTFESQIPLNSGDPEDISTRPGESLYIQLLLDENRWMKPGVSGSIGHWVWPENGDEVDISTYGILVLNDGTSSILTPDSSSVTIPEEVPIVDLIIEDTTWSPAQPAIGEYTTFTVTLKNQGTGKASSSYTAWYIDDKKMDDFFTKELDAGATCSVSLSWYAQQGPHTIKIIADSESQINEDDESNNIKTFTFTPTPRASSDETIEALIALWHFEEGKENYAYDSSGDNNTAWLMNMDLSKCWVDGKRGKALKFDGTNDYVNCGAGEKLNLGTAPFTLELWVNFDSLSGEQVLIEKYIETLSSTRTGWCLTKLANNYLRLCNGENSTYSDGAIIPDVKPEITPGQWYHVAVTRIGDTFTLYWNGLPISSNTIALNLDSYAALKIGHRGIKADTPGSSDYRGMYFKGIIDEVRIYNVGLSAEIMAQHALGAYGVNP